MYKCRNCGSRDLLIRGTTLSTCTLHIWQKPDGVRELLHVSDELDLEEWLEECKACGASDDDIKYPDDTYLIYDEEE